MTEEEADSEELKDTFSLPPDADGLHHITLGAESTDELGQDVVRVIPKDAPVQEFDSVMVCQLAGEPTLFAKEAVRFEGEAHLLPSRIWPFDEIEAILIPLHDGRVEEVGGDVIGVNADGP